MYSVLAICGEKGFSDKEVICPYGVDTVSVVDSACALLQEDMIVDVVAELAWIC
jgi:hypothetical protein